MVVIKKNIPMNTKGKFCNARHFFSFSSTYEAVSGNFINNTKQNSQDKPQEGKPETVEGVEGEGDVEKESNREKYTKLFHYLILTIDKRGEGGYGDEDKVKV